jgi:hypothetical protein
MARHSSTVTSGGCWRSASITASTSPRAICQPRITAVDRPRSVSRRSTRSFAWLAASSAASSQVRSGLSSSTTISS